MSFGLLKHFKDLKKNAADVKQTPHAKHVILGQDLSAVLKLVELRKNHAGESIRLIANRLFTKQNLVENYEYGVTQLRSSQAVEAIYKKYFEAKILPHTQEPTFYKDGKFHEFSGRAKPMQLLNGEPFFAQKGYQLSIESFFAPEDWNNLDAILHEAMEVRIFESITKTVPTDLVEVNEWGLSFKDFTSMNCENLYLASSPKKFLSLLSNKDQLSSELIDLCSGVNIQSALSVTLVLKQDFQHSRQTLFIPQSMTHEWGHFIVEFDDYNHQTKQQLCHVLILIHEEEPQTEELGGKIKLMKRVLDRVFPQLESSLMKEYIRLDEEMFITDIKDEGLMQVSFDYPSLKFLGQMGPLPSALGGERFLARVLLN